MRLGREARVTSGEVEEGGLGVPTQGLALLCDVSGAHACLYSMYWGTDQPMRDFVRVRVRIHIGVWLNHICVLFCG